MSAQAMRAAGNRRPIRALARSAILTGLECINQDRRGHSAQVPAFLQIYGHGLKVIGSSKCANDRCPSDLGQVFGGFVTMELHKVEPKRTGNIVDLGGRCVHKHTHAGNTAGQHGDDILGASKVDTPWTRGAKIEPDRVRS